MEILSFKVFKFSYKQNTNLFSAYSYFNDAIDYYNDDDNDIRDDDCYKIFIAEHLFRYSVLYSVLGFFATTLLEPYSKSKKPTRLCLMMRHVLYLLYLFLVLDVCKLLSRNEKDNDKGRFVNPSCTR